jgi:hypothetical protein
MRLRRLEGREKRLVHRADVKIGFVFQNFNLLDRLDARENIELPLIYAGVNKRSRREIAETALRLVGLTDRAKHRPAPAAKLRPTFGHLGKGRRCRRSLSLRGCRQRRHLQVSFASLRWRARRPPSHGLISRWARSREASMFRFPEAAATRHPSRLSLSPA